VYTCLTQLHIVVSDRYTNSNLIYYKHNGDDETYASVSYFKRKIELSGFSAFLDSSPSQLIRIIGVLFYTDPYIWFISVFRIKIIIITLCQLYTHCTKGEGSPLYPFCVSTRYLMLADLGDRNMYYC